MSETKLFAVAGNPVLHSMSPQMHNAAFAELQLDAVYFRLVSASGKEAMQTAKQMGVAGMNVTAPFKEEMLGLMGELDESTKAIGAVNTVKLDKDGTAVGFNTDSFGVSQALKENGIALSGSKAVVLGAGGAAKAAAHALVSSGASVTVANRTKEKARELAESFGCAHCSLDVVELEKALCDAKILVSTLSTAERVVKPELLGKELVVFDAVYGKNTAISADAKARECKVISGREWLLFQGVKAFEIFTGKKAPVEIMRKAVSEAANSKKSKKSNIALVGSMGSGKSTTAKETANLADMRLVEIDDEIMRKAGKSISRIFDEEGEQAFRKLESGAVAALAGEKNCVISCGGGAVLDARNVEMLRSNCTVVWLFASAEETVARLKQDHSRPLMEKIDRLAAAREILAARMKAYAHCCDFAISTEKKSQKETAKQIMDEIGKVG